MDIMMSTKATVWLLLAFLIQSRAESQWRCRNPECHCEFDSTSTQDTWMCYNKKYSEQNGSPRDETVSLIVNNGSVYHESRPEYHLGRSDPEEESMLPLEITFMRAKRKSLLNINCGHFSSQKISNLNSSLYDSLPQLDLVNSKLIALKLMDCPFPDMSFLSFLQILNLTNVNELIISASENNITLNSSYFDGIPSMEIISLTFNSGLKELPADLFKETVNLKSLDLTNNKISQLDVNMFQHLKKLEILDLGVNEISELDPRIFQNLTSLKSLNIDYNRLVNLPRALFTNVPNLSSLTISGNNYTVLESGVFDDLVKLKILHAHKTQLQTFPADLFSKTKELREVKMFYNKLFKLLPSGLFSNLPKLTLVDIRETSIEELPLDLFWNSPKLENLYLIGHKKLKTINSELFRDCKELTTLNLSNNGFESLPGNVFEFLEKLTDLNLSKNRLENITENMFSGIDHLKTLNLNRNKLKFIGPTSFDFLTELKEIDLSYNMLEFDPDFSYSPLKSCVKLETMDLSHNWISELYEDWRFSFTRLKLLNLSWNKFTIIRDVVDSIVSSGMTLDLSNNQISVVDLSTMEGMAHQQEEFQEPNKIILDENPIACNNCSNYDLFRFFQKIMSPKVYEMIRIDTPHMKCKDLTFQNRALKSVHPMELTCPNDQCPLSCKCTFAPFYKRMTVNCSSKNLIELPQNLPNTYRNTSDVTNIKLILSNNSIQVLPQNVSEEYACLVTELDLSHNQVSNGEEFVRRIPKLEKLVLSGNQLVSLSEEFVNLSNASNIRSLYLSGNPWYCDCGITELFNFILDRPDMVRDSNKIMCDEKPLNGVSTDYFCPLFNPYIITSIVLGILGVIFGLLVLFYYKFEHEIKVWLFAHNWLLCWITEDDIDQDKEYDAFISYAEDDYRFVVKELIPELEKTYKVCHHHRDFIGGVPIDEQIIKSVHKSRRTIIVLTENFVNSYWGMEEFKTAYLQAVKDKCPRIIMIIYKQVPPQDSMKEEMKSYLKTYTYIKYNEKNNWFWSQIHYAMRYRSRKTITNDTAVKKYKLGMNGIGYNKQDTTVLFTDEKENQPGQFTTQIMQKG